VEEKDALIKKKSPVSTSPGTKQSSGESKVIKTEKVGVSEMSVGSSGRKRRTNKEKKSRRKGTKQGKIGV